MLEDEMSGIKRLPALIFSEFDKMLEQLSLSNYEIVNNEPLHNIPDQIKNLHSQISFHLKQKKQLVVIINTSFKDKAARNSSDTDRFYYMSATGSLKTIRHNKNSKHCS